MFNNPTASSKGARTSLIEIGALIAVIILVLWFFVLPKRAALNAQRTELKQQEEVLANSKKDSENLVRLISQLNRSGADIALLDEALPLESRITKLEFLLDSLISASGMRLGLMNVDATTLGVAAGDKKTLADPFAAPRKLQTITMEVNVSGNVDQFKNLLQLLESNSRIIDVVSIDITNEEEGSAFKIKLKSYSYAP
jgi:Tfp pilus assembly protein PilO